MTWYAFNSIELKERDFLSKSPNIDAGDTSGDVDASDTSGQPNDSMDLLLRENVIFIGETLGPFFLADPTDDTIKPAFVAIRDINVKAAAKDWPFVDEQTALDALEQMQQDLNDAEQGEAAVEGDKPEGNPGASTDIVISDDLIWEYRRLFIGPAAKPAPPWGSVYTDWERVVFGESTLALRQWMRENGIERMSGEGTPEDHIGLMLLLMAWIAENKPEALTDYLRLHLLTWSSHFLQQLSDVAEHPFYEGLALLTKASLEGIQEALSLEVEYPRFYR